jgi:peptide/nickel transport system substrate-binding protein
MALRSVARAVSLAALLGATVVAPVSTHRAARAATEKTLIVGWDISDVTTMDPDLVYEPTEVLVNHQTYDSLVTLHGGDVAHIQPDLATAWTVSKDGSVLTFKLRRGVKFVSGNPLTADDVVFSYKRLQRLNGIPSQLVSSMKDIRALDPSTVQITLKAPDASFLGAMTTPQFAVLDSRTVLAKGGTDAADAAKTDKATAYLDANSPGTGPYILKAWDRNARVVLDANPKYWGPAPYFQEVILNGVKDAETQKLQLQKGDAQMAFNLSSDQVAALKGDANVKVSLGETLDYVYLAMNVSPAVSVPLSNPLVRQGIRYAIDYQGIIRKLLDGAGRQQTSIIPIGYVGNSVAQNAAQAIKTDPARARTLFAQAGYPNGFALTMEYPTNLTFEGLAMDSLAIKLISDFKAVGISVTPRARQLSVWLADYRAGKIEMSLGPWGADYADAYDNLSYFGPGDTVGKRVNYLQDGALAALIAKGDSTNDVAARGAIYNQVQQRLLQTGPWAVLVSPDYPVGLRSNINGFVYAPIWKADFATLSR